MKTNSARSVWAWRIPIIRVALTSEVIPDIAGLAALEGAKALFIIRMAVPRDHIFASGYRTVLSSQSNVARDFYASCRTLAPEQSPLLALPILFKDTYAVLPAAAVFSDGECPSLLDAIDGGGIGHSH
jgi:hypothetical protein